MLRIHKFIGYIFILALVLWAKPPCYGAKHALLVGINDYGSASGWNKIHGADDVKLFEVLLKRNGYKVKALKEKEANKSNVIAQIEALIAASKTGDVVYLHFSCHGQPVEDLDNDEDDGWDEAIVLYGAYKKYGDHGYKGENHLTDDELCQYLTQLRANLGQDGLLYVIMDACHAGTSSRGNKLVRGTNKAFCFNGIKQYKVDKHKGHPQYYKLKSQEGHCDIILLEACRAWENNQEIMIDKMHTPIDTTMPPGSVYGSLSYHVYRQVYTSGINKDTGWITKVKEAMDADKTLMRQKMVIEYSTTRITAP